MFDYAASGNNRKFGGSRMATTTVSLVAHVAAIVVLVVPALYAVNLPAQPDTIAAFVAAPVLPPPPPPPPPPAAAEPPAKPRTSKPRPPERPRKIIREVRRAPVAAPVEAPSEIRPETGLEPDSVEAGFEKEIDIEGGVAGGIVGGVVGGAEALVPPPPPPPPVRPAAPVRVGGNITAPRLVHRVAPEYPMMAAHAQVEAVVILEATVNTRGRVDSVHALRSHPLLERAAIDAVRQWQYEPLMLNGTPHPFVLTVTVSFNLK